MQLGKTLVNSTDLHSYTLPYSLHPLKSKSHIKHQNACNRNSYSSSRFITMISQPTSTLSLWLCAVLCNLLSISIFPSSVEAFPMRYSLLASNETETPPYDQPLLLDVGQKTVISSHNKALGTILILFGFILVFFGFKLIRMTLILMGFTSWVLRWDLFSELFHPAHYYFWMWFLAGLTGALLAIRFWIVGVAMVGGFGGFSLAMGIIAASNSSLSNLYRFIILAFLITLGASLSIIFERYMVILGSSFSGAFILMYGVDEFLQEGYREMFFLFDFTGMILRYHPNHKVYTMIGSSLGLACLGTLWELWRHKTPLWKDGEALFWIHGHPFGKRTLVFGGRKVGHKEGTRSNVMSSQQKSEATFETQIGNDRAEESVENVKEVVIIAENDPLTTSERALPVDSETNTCPRLPQPSDSVVEFMSEIETIIQNVSEGSPSSMKFNSTTASLQESIETLSPVEAAVTSDLELEDTSENNSSPSPSSIVD